jgi:lysozyme family protein
MNFNDAFAYVVGEEGKLSLDPEDCGNWTGGARGVGELKGTKYGVSAAAYPLLDIASLSLSDARDIAKRDYWDKIAGDTLRYGIALLLFDFEYNAGKGEAIRVAQRALGLTADGALGPHTLAALKLTSLTGFAQDFTDARIAAYRKMTGWDEYGKGWTNRANLTCKMATA